MSTVHQLSRTDARPIAVQAQLVDAERPAGLLALVRHLSLLQLDPTLAVAPSADLVAWSRLGSSYSPTELRDALDDGLGAADDARAAGHLRRAVGLNRVDQQPQR